MSRKDVERAHKERSLISNISARYICILVFKKEEAHSNVRNDYQKKFNFYEKRFRGICTRRWKSKST